MLQVARHLGTKNVVLLRNPTKPFSVDASVVCEVIEQQVEQSICWPLTPPNLTCLQLWMKIAPERLEMEPITRIGPHSVTVHVDQQTQRALQVDVLPAN